MASPTDLADDDERRTVYRYVERHGPVEPSVVADAVGTDPESFQHHLAILKRDALLAETDEGRLVVALDSGEAVEHREAGVAYTIRPARPADISGVVGVIRTITDECCYVVASSVADRLVYEETVVRRNPTECRVLFVATVEDDVVGWCHVTTPDADHLSNTAELTLGVLSEYRRHGIGSHLLQRGVEWAAARGCRKVYNSVPACNERAIEFLLGAGWTVEAVRADHYELDGDLVDETMLARDL
ncbi:bifunctional helix-turn-helix transcriptional regulator/GNAT family N-acetyltransferase [Haloarcula litorea]|uniref:bifunctional helix-turn-helix transcriptional regulator/GNAT family N-acetyltransferase n=1 Tax=Haloarcula litorea TaxID=3032579 RepID=UPI0023E8661B|nr:bifunctional helix-turn-helix transcriptional regulator/GNAT family N-acetyltransferase [Halomicroarcula sp. GDY20]